MLKFNEQVIFNKNILNLFVSLFFRMGRWMEYFEDFLNPTNMPSCLEVESVEAVECDVTDSI